MNLRLPVSTALMLLLSPLRADVTNIARPDFQNITATGLLQTKNPYVTHFQGHIKTAAQAPASGTVRLTEFSCGQPFAPWVPYAGFTDYSGYATQVAAGVRALLYPPAGANR